MIVSLFWYVYVTYINIVVAYNNRISYSYYAIITCLVCWGWPRGIRANIW